LLTTLAKCKKIDIIDDKAKLPPGCISDISNNSIEVYVNMLENVNVE